MNVGQILIFLFVSIFHRINAETEEKFGRETEACASLLEDFAIAAADFMLCSISNARPIHMCSSCVGAYNGVMEGHTRIFEIGESPNTTCKDKLINLDRLEIIEAGYSYVKDLWSKGQCKNCFIEQTNESLPFELTNNTKEFQRLYSDTSQCLENNYNETSDTYDPDVCNICSKNYSEMNNFYMKLKTYQGNGQLCMDIVDTMNMTQNLWSDILHCGKTVMTPEIPLIACSSILLIIPVIFYLCAWKFSTARPSALSQQKRLVQRFRERLRSRAGSTNSRFRF